MSQSYGNVEYNSAGTSSASVASPDNVVKMPALSNVARGQLVTLLENKKVTKFVPAVTLAVEGNNTAPLSVQYTTNALHTSSVIGEENHDVCQLSNGNMLSIAYNEISLAAEFTVCSPIGSTVVALTPIVGSRHIAVAALPNGKFVVVFDTAGSPNVLKAVIYNNDGTPAVAPWIIYTSSNSLGFNVRVHAFGNSNFLVTNSEASYGIYRYRVYDSTGALVGSMQTLTSAGDVSQNVGRLKRLANGNIVIYYREGAPGSTCSYYFMVVSNTGATIVAPTLLITQTPHDGNNVIGPLYTMQSSFVLAELSNNNLIFIGPDNSDDNKAAVYLRNAAGVAITKITLSTSYYSARFTPAVIPNDRGGFAITGLLNSAFYYSTYTASGIPEQATPLTIAEMAVGTDSNVAGTQCHSAGVYLENWGYLVMVAGHSGSSSNSLTVGLFSEATTGGGNWVWTRIGGSTFAETFSSSVGSAILPRFLAVASQRLVQFVYSHGISNSLKMRIFNTMRSALLGVAKDDYIANTPIPIEVTGMFYLPADQEMPANTIFDHRSNALTGNKGTFVGRNVKLAGPTF